MSAQQEYSQNSYNKLGMFTFISSMVVSCAVLIYVSFLSGGIDLKEVQELKPGEKVPAANAPATPDAPGAASGAAPAPAATSTPAPAPKGASREKVWLSSPIVIDRGAALFALNDRWSRVHLVGSISKNQIAGSDTDVAAMAASLN